MATLTLSIELTSITCANCSGVYAITKEYMEEAMRLGNFCKCWTCPYCQSQRGYGIGTVQKLQQEKAEIAATLVKARNAETAALAEAKYFREQRDKESKALNQHKKRSQNGVCTCCNRSFTNLRRHMQTKHPEAK